MLKRVEVENFRGFKDRMVLDLSSGAYAFNPNLVDDNRKIVKNALISGKNGVGKSALGIAIFDVIRHLTDKQQIPLRYVDPYKNLENDSRVVVFKYVFSFSDDEDVVYEYEKTAPDELVAERLWFKGEQVLDWQHEVGGRRVVADSFSFGLVMANVATGVSPLKFVFSSLSKDRVPLLAQLIEFVENMLWYRSVLTGIGVAGASHGYVSFSEEIYKRDKLEDYMAFLRECDLNYNICFKEVDGRPTLFAEYGNGRFAQMSSVASSGTTALTLFYYWSIAAFDRISFMFVDEFDAFFHFEAARKVIERLNMTHGFQVIMTTHNTYLMQNELTRPDCCYIMTKQHIVPLNKATDKEIRQAHNLEKMYTHGAFNVG